MTYAASPRLTLVAKLLGRYVSNLYRIQDIYEPHATVADVETMRRVAEGRGANQVLAVGGMKINIGHGTCWCG